MLSRFLPGIAFLGCEALFFSHPTSTSAPSRTATASRRTFTSGATTSSESAATETSTQHTAAAAAVHVAPTRAPPVSEMALLEGSEDSSADSGNHASHNRFLTAPARMLLAHPTVLTNMVSVVVSLRQQVANRKILHK